MSSYDNMEEVRETFKRSSSELNDGNDSPAKKAKKNGKNGKLEGQGDWITKSDSQETVDFNVEDSGVYRPPCQSRREASGENVFIENSAACHSSTPVNLTMTRIESVQRDAETIAAIIPEIDVTKAYEKLAAKREVTNRLDIVTSELIENYADNTSKDGTSASEEEKMLNLYNDVKQVVYLVKQVSPNLKLNPAEVYVLLERNQNVDRRTTDVADLFLRDGNTSRNDVSAGDLFNDVQTVVAQLPTANPDNVYQLLESFINRTDRVQCVVDKLTISTDKSDLKRDDSYPDNPLLRNNPVFMDMRKIAKMFPEMDRNEIYAYIEAHHDERDRVQVVIEEILRSSKGSLSSSLSVSSDQGGIIPSIHEPRGVYGLQDEVDTLREIFPDCDPNYLFDQLEQKANDAERIKTIAASMFEHRNYPKLKEVLHKQQRAAKKMAITNLKFDIDDFLAKFPNPVEFFDNTEPPMTDNYKEHCLAYVKNNFEWFKDGYLKTTLEKHKYHLAPALREILDTKSEFDEEQRVSKKLRTEARTNITPFPEEPDERFYHELLFSENQQKIKDHFLMLEFNRKRKVANAKKKGELYECGCCFDDEILFEELTACADGHLFCRECIRRSTESALGDGKTTFPCLTAHCEYKIPLAVLQEVLTASVFSRLLSRLQEEEVRLADIPDLVACPFCSFATVMPDADDKVFKCLNPDCLKESCRMCKEPNHVPLKCSEVEKQGETSMRAYIENRISEAMLRTCHKCKKRFIKDYGCNKMTCTCGATMCYVCRQPDIDYDHFNGGRCSTTEEAKKIHLEEMELAAKQAKEEYLRDHPETENKEFTYDPKKLIQEYKSNISIENEEEEDEEEDEEEEVEEEEEYQYDMAAYQ